MADSTTFRRCIIAFHSTAAGRGVVQKDEVRTSGDAVVVANPAYFVALTDADLSNGSMRLHP
jgi:hypothetical protein